CKRTANNWPRCWSVRPLNRPRRRRAEVNSVRHGRWCDMSEPSKSVWQREVLPRFPPFRWAGQMVRWLFSRRGMGRMLIILAWTVTIVALFYGIENLRGGRAWNSYRKQVEERGEVLDFKAFIPAPVPDEQNFAATPFFKSLFEHSTEQNFFDT